MIHSISRKLALLTLTSLLLFALVIGSLIGLFQLQTFTQKNLQALIQIQLSVEQLRGQLWVFLQYDDPDSLEQVYIAQSNLAEKIDQYHEEIADLAVLQKMNQNLSMLISQERSLNHQIPGNEMRRPEARDFLHSRYNMLVQSMTEELLYIQRSVLDNSTTDQKSTLISSAVMLTAFSALVALIALFIFRRFRKGYFALKLEMLKIGRGLLDTRGVNSRLDIEFQSLLHFCNKMKESLRRVTITRDEMQEEICRQTALLTKQKEELLFLSEHDHLTGLLNRRAFEIRLNYAIRNSTRTERKFALLYLDLDKFKVINDCDGHDVGDHLLQGVAERMKLHLRNTDLIGRCGGDEFVICLNLLQDFSGVENKARCIKEAVEQPIDINGKTYQISVSIGISYFPDDAGSLEELFKIADIEMYKNKPGNQDDR